MTISYRLDFAEDYAKKHRKAWTLYRLLEGKLSSPASSSATRTATHADKRPEKLGSYSTLREVVDAIAQDKAKQSSPPW